MTVELEKLKFKLIKMKDKEAKLEADLAIREFPELKDAIYDLIVAMAELRRLDNDLKLMKTKFDVGKMEKAREQLAFYQKKIISLEKLSNITAKAQVRFFKAKVAAIKDSGNDESVPAHDGMSLKRARSLEELNHAYEVWSEKLLEAGFNIKHFLPSVFDYLEQVN